MYYEGALVFRMPRLILNTKPCLPSARLFQNAKGLLEWPSHSEWRNCPLNDPLGIENESAEG